MGALKWIGGLLGWASGGPIGALLGYFVGSVIENGMESFRTLTGGSQPGNGGWQGTGQSGQWSRQQTYTESSSSGRKPGGYSTTEQRNSFMLSLLVLSSAVIRADGRYLQSELDYVRAFVRRNFGFVAENEAMAIIEDLKGKDIDIYAVGGQIAGNMNYSQRLQLFHYLADLANADGEVCENERRVLSSIATAIGITSADADSILAMFSKAEESAYTVLEISPDATDDEVKTAYRRLAMKYHPDKVAQLGPDVQEAAKVKFQNIQAAYEKIKKERGI